MTLQNSPWQALIFDLDDTLLDTSGQLIPAANQRAFSFLVEQGAAPSVQQCEKQWEQWHLQLSGPSLFAKLATEFSSEKAHSMGHQAYQIFRSSPLPENLQLRAGGQEVLKKAAAVAPLFLVTQGDIRNQIKKVDLLKIISWFKHVYYIDPMAGGSKADAFETILGEHQLTPEKVLSIGNRLDNEIMFSKQKGMKTCYVRYGEHSHEPIQNADQKPDFIIVELLELLPLILNLGGCHG